jgi:hypothetical protein
LPLDALQSSGRPQSLELTVPPEQKRSVDPEQAGAASKVWRVAPQICS